jgi:hypothetical protein
VKSNPRNKLIHGRHRCGKGRNARGIITARHRGGGYKRLYRKIDFRRNQKDISGRIITIEYVPNRNAFATAPVGSIPLTKPLPMSRRLILQQARGQRSLSPPTAWELSTVSRSISVPTGGSFHLSLTVLLRYRSPRSI